MTRPHDVDFRFQLWPHGWSSACIWIDGTPTEFRLTHVFNDPLESLAESALCLANGESSATIEWSDEPGTYILTFEKMSAEHHLLSVEISEYSKELLTYTPNDLIGSTTFIVARDFWMRLVAQELGRIASSFRYRHYREARHYCFPQELYQQLRIQLDAGHPTS